MCDTASENIVSNLNLRAEVIAGIFQFYRTFVVFFFQYTNDVSLCINYLN